MGGARDSVAGAIDVGGTKVAAALVDRRGRIHSRFREPTAQESGEALVGQVLELGRRLLAESDGAVVGLGVAVAAVVEPESGFVRWAPNLPWRDVPLGTVLQDALDLPVLIAHDGHAAALGEHWTGAGRGARNVAFLIAGTGVGAGFVLDGRLYRGSRNLAGAVGWMIVDPRLTERPRAREVGCLESLVAGPAIAAEARSIRVNGASAPPPTAVEVFEAAKLGDSAATAVVEQAARAFAHAVVGIVSVLDPDVVIVGGGVGGTDVFLARARQAVSDFAQPVSGRAVRIVPSALGEDAGLAGAAHLVFQHASADEEAARSSATNRRDET
jgi:glucokinase